MNKTAMVTLAIGAALSVASCSASSGNLSPEHKVILQDDLAAFTRIAQIVAAKDANAMQAIATADTRYCYGHDAGEGGGTRSSNPKTAAELFQTCTWRFDPMTPTSLRYDPVRVDRDKSEPEIEASYDVPGQPGLVVAIKVLFARTDRGPVVRSLTVKENCLRTK